eukprot:1152972-Pelagomonas_calceolata.AAC.2
MARLVEGMGSIDSPTHTQKDCVESDLSTLQLFAQLTALIMRSTQCEGGVGSMLGLVRQGVTKIALGQLEVVLGQMVCAAYIHMCKRAYKASGSFEANRMLLVGEGVCAVPENCAFHPACLAICISKPVLAYISDFKAFLRSGKYFRLGVGEEGSDVLGLASFRASNQYCRKGCRLGQR